jgi:hypothetical protein
MHTTNASPYLITVIEIVLVLVEQDESETPVSAGWTFYYPFNLEKNGLDVTEIWAEENAQVHPDVKKAKVYIFFL